MTGGATRIVNLNRSVANREGPTDDDLREIDRHVDRITGAINNILVTFQSLFTGYQFLRMNQAFAGVSPSNFMDNFNSSFNPDNELLEIVRRISLQEAEENRKKNKASIEAVKKLPVIKIETKHCKQNKMQPGGLRPTASRGKDKRLEAPTCTICVE